MSVRLRYRGGRLVVEGVPQLRRALRDVGGRELEKKLGQVHRDIGEMVIRRAGGRNTGVGTGRGATIRPSAALREVLLRVGGTHRAQPLPSGRTTGIRLRQWGVNPIWPPPSRPYLIGAAQDISGDIEDAYMDGVRKVWSQAW